MHRGHAVEVAVERIDAGVDQHHADAARLGHGQALVDASSRATVAQDDLAGDLRRIEDRHATVVDSREAQAYRRRVRTGQAGGLRVDERRRTDGRRVGGRARVGRAIAERHRLRRSCGRACRPRRSSPTGWGARQSTRSGRSCPPRWRRRRPRRPRTATRSRPGRGSWVRAADREVDHVHAVDDGLVDRRNAVCREATCIGRADSTPQQTL